MKRHIARATLLLFSLLVSSCAGHGAGTSPIPTAATPAQLAPDVWQRGTPPVAWQMFKLGGGQLAYSWPMIDPNKNVAYGVTRSDGAGTLPGIGTYDAMNYSGAPGPHRTDSISPLFDPIQIFPCSNGQFVCMRGWHYALGPGGTVYDGNNTPGVIDATAGAGNAIWFTTCCNGSYIVRGLNGGLHFFRIPNTSDRLARIAYARDGRVWVTLQDHVTKMWRLARLDPTTSLVTVFPFQMPVTPRQLAIGPDGNLWFAIGSTLYRVNASSALLTRFALTRPSTGYIAFAQSGMAWVGYESGSARGFMHVAASGSVVEAVSCPTSVCALDNPANHILQFTVGPDDNVWFAYSNTVVEQSDRPDNPNQGIGVYVYHAISVTPASLILGVGQTATIAYSEAHYTGTMTAASTGAGIVRVVKYLSPGSVQVQGVYPGTARIIVRDTLNNYYGVNVTVR